MQINHFSAKVFNLLKIYPFADENPHFLYRSADCTKNMVYENGVLSDETSSVCYGVYTNINININITKNQMTWSGIDTGKVDCYLKLTYFNKDGKDKMKHWTEI